MQEINLGLTFDDVLLIPQYTSITSRSEVNLRSKFSRNVPLNIPLVSSPMDTVTETEMAIGLARLGGLGIIHRYQSIDDQASQVSLVKNKESHFIETPFSISQFTSLAELKVIQQNNQLGTFLIDDSQYDDNLVLNQEQQSPLKRKRSLQMIQKKLVGILTQRDLKFQNYDKNTQVVKIMTKLENMVYYIQKKNEVLQDSKYFYNLMMEKKVEKIPILDEEMNIKGLITLKDINRNQEFPFANLDQKGQLYVGASIGATGDYIERTLKLVEAGVDVLIIDVANGHNQLAIDAVKKVKQLLKSMNQSQVDVVAGSIATSEGAQKLIEAGADGIRCGIGNGSICITRIVAGAGVPQLTAIMDVQQVCKKYNVPLISDGGNRNSGNMCKALCAGADCIMLGRLVAGCNESPSKVVYRDGKLMKIYRGMAGYGANVSKSQRMGEKEAQPDKFTPEGVEGYIPYAGPLKDVIHQFIQGIKSGMSYVGGQDIQQAQKKAKFIRMTQSGYRESGVHDINKI